MRETLEFGSEKYNLTVVSDRITVNYATTRMVQATQLTAEGTKTREVPAKALFGSDLGPVLWATPEDNGEWYVDHEAGFMRWCGRKTGPALAKALRQCGYAQDVVRAAMTAARRARKASN